MSEIPEDVMAAARTIAGMVFNAYHDDDGVLGLGAPHLIVARALMAEREKGLAADGWRQIATAPTDGTDVLVINVFGNMTGYGCKVGWFNPSSGRWVSTYEGKTLHDPSHWMPLPSPPRVEKQFG